MERFAIIPKAVSKTRFHLHFSAEFHMSKLKDGIFPTGINVQFICKILR